MDEREFNYLVKENSDYLIFKNDLKEIFTESNGF